MVLSILLILLIATFFSLFNFKNKFVNIITLQIYSVCMMMFASVLYVSKFLNYTNIGAFDFQLYLWLSKLKISFGQINLIYNISILIFVFAAFSFVTIIRQRSRRTVFPIFAFTGLFFAFTNSYSFIWFLYSKIYYMQGSNESVLYTIASKLILFINLAIIISAFVLPLVYLCKYYINTKINTKKRNALSYTFCMCAIDLYIALMFYFSVFPSFACCNIESVGIPQLIASDSIPIVFSLFLIFVTTLVIIMILYYKPFNQYMLVKMREIARNSAQINKNIRMTLHIYKNAFIGIEKKTEMAEVLIKSEDTAAVSTQLNDISTLARDSIARIEHMLNALREPSMFFENASLRECVENALAKASVPETVTVFCDTIPADTLVYASIEHLTEVFVNILLNAVEAIRAKNAEQGEIEITFVDEGDLVALNFTDNGCGIPKSSQREIFKPFFTTKSATECGGVGLDYVKRVVKSHHGDVYVKSKLNVYTMFQVVLPSAKKENSNG